MTKILIDREDLIRMAHEAEQPTKTCWLAYEVEFLERFANLVAEHEREQCAKVCEEEAKQFMQCTGSMIARMTGKQTVLKIAQIPSEQGATSDYTRTNPHPSPASRCC